MILSANGRHIRILRSLGYAAPEIARLLAVELEAVESFLDRIVPLRRAALVRPRGRTEHARIRLPQRRPDRRPPYWRDRDDVGPDGQPLELSSPPIVEDDDLAVPELRTEPAPAAADWVGGSTFTGGHRKLTHEQAAVIRQERADGASIYALARRHGVSRNTIYAALNDDAPPAPLPCAAADCSENGQKQGENGE